MADVEQEIFERVPETCSEMVQLFEYAYDELQSARAALKKAQACEDLPLHREHLDDVDYHLECLFGSLQKIDWADDAARHNIRQGWLAHAEELMEEIQGGGK